MNYYVCNSTRYMQLHIFYFVSTVGHSSDVNVYVYIVRSFYYLVILSNTNGNVKQSGNILP
jgi:hypothetical protein